MLLQKIGIGVLISYSLLAWAGNEIVESQSGSTLPSATPLEWKPVSGAIANLGSKEAYFYPNHNSNTTPEKFGLPSGTIYPAGGIGDELMKCIDLQETKIGNQVWFRFRLKTAYDRKQPEYDQCRRDASERSAYEACDSKVKFVCAGEYYYLPQKDKDGVNYWKTGR